MMNNYSFSIWEIGMLLCFAFSWPLSIIKSLKTKFVLGKSPFFMGIVLSGYVFGIVHKLTNSYDIVIYLYVFNFILISFDLFLYFYYAPKNRAAAKEFSLQAQSERQSDDIRNN